VVIVSERAAERLWPGRDPIGQQVLWGPLNAENPYCTVVGVVGNVKQSTTDDEQGLELYYPYTQYPITSVYYVLRTSGDPLRLAQAARAVVHEHDPQAGIVFAKSMDQLIGESLWQWRLWGVLFTVFAGIALALAAIGLYGLLSYSVAQRQREIGIRMALGSPAADVLRLVIIEGMKPTLIGVGLGLAGAAALGRVLSTLIFGVGARDAVTFSAVAALVAVAGIVASAVPAYRATRVNPLTALRTE
jgi:putative ABC transport system permease protein